MKKIRVLIVEDSNVIRELLEYIIGRDPRLEIAGAVGSAEEALRVLHRISPDVISMDIRLPGMNGFEATQRIMAEKPTPIVMVAGSVESEYSKITVNALEAGALTVFEKPVGPTSAKYEAVAERLCTQLAIMSQVSVVRRRRIVSSGPRRERPLAEISSEYRMLGIVSSTGGPSALAQLLGTLGPDFPLPILLVQHISSNFLEGFATWLQSVCPFSIKIVENREVTAPGCVYLATRNRHLRLGHDCVEMDFGAPVCSQRPSGTVLFESMASILGTRALGVLLTGMGEDGAEGLFRVREAGGYTIAEDESTAVVYGMPAAAVRLGGVCESLPLPAIGLRILELVKYSPRRMFQHPS
ncbi:MAG TPA: chemotaxis-specific protein-glutamate methyltransferase CheB [Bryobacteraceae bacterium]|jgi:two-component system chemotaxis response regulator CheB|nr:chemotaxis-specific protein-glutamate methyltransferase CheB [Bryobacteraceae bacterium]